MLFSSFLGDSDLPGFCWLLLQMSSSFGVFSSRILLSSPSNSVVVFLSRFCFSGTVVFLYIVFKVVFYAFSLLSSSLVLLSSTVVFSFYLSSSSVVLFMFSFRCLQLSSVDSVNLVFLVLQH